MWISQSEITSMSCSSSWSFLKESREGQSWIPRKWFQSCSPAFPTALCTSCKIKALKILIYTVEIQFTNYKRKLEWILQQNNMRDVEWQEDNHWIPAIQQQKSWGWWGEPVFNRFNTAVNAQPPADLPLVCLQSKAMPL